ncbi:hypothetical protein PstZobell_02371 [Stutzerimonas stutzeri ATCC 14405 = CCUG 16156]|uniref:hypothetical protein n=1 Tax=Pseudomonadaceae TaxID=135621 RepID=UPI0002548D49|nr:MULTISPECIES: hypothetical protein [Pseudomonadaceae]EHY76268.1 hypothetical protein PstZobell_02371 [Stutzerimonas stutzeri ATCC 14405 = CCUG 16156]QOZ96295.1 hypothetical protein Pstu14405_13595 [Stutzerimonas stutzeri]
MKILRKALTVLALTMAASLAVATETGQESQMRHDYSAADGKQVLNKLLKDGKVLSVDYKGKRVMGRSDGRVRPYEIKIRTPDGVIHTVEYRGVPVGINNG